MNRAELEQFIQNNYSVEPEYPWARYPSYEVFRHDNNKKWFALLMDVPKSKLGLPETEMLEVANFKCSPLLIGSLLEEQGFFFDTKKPYSCVGRNCTGRKSKSAVGLEL